MENKPSNKDLNAVWVKIENLERLLAKRTTDSEREAANASKKASEFRNRTEETKNTADGYLKEIETTKVRYQNEVDKFKVLIATITNINDKYKNNLSALERDIDLVKSKKDEITSMIDDLDSYFENNPNISEQIKVLDNLITTGNEEAVKINQILKNSINRKKEIDELYFDIMGSIDIDDETGEETKIEGLKDKLETSYKSIEESIKGLTTILGTIKRQSEDDYLEIEENWQGNFTKLEKEIQGLLPNALTAGLSSAYSDKKKKEETDMILLESDFKRSIWGLVAVSLIPFAVGITMLLKGDSLHDTILSLPRILLAILPIYIPVLWLAYSANKKMKLSKRLIEEYTHKEVISRTFEGLSKQISGISDHSISSELKIKLLYNLLDVSAENPGKLISDYDKSDHPIIDAIDKSAKLSRSVDKLEKIPGFKKITKILEKRAERMIKQEVSAIEETIDVVNDLKDNK